MGLNTVKEDELLEEQVNFVVIKRLFKYLKPYKVQVIKTLLLIFLAAAIDLFNPYFMKLGIDVFITKGDYKGLILLTISMIILNVVAMFLGRIRVTVMAGVTNKILLTIRQDLYNHIQKLSFSFFDNRPVGKILARIIGDVNSLGELFTNSVTSLIPEAIKISAVVVIMLSMNFWLGLMALTTLPFLLISMFLIQTKSRKRWQIYRKKNSNMNAFTHEDFSGIRVVQSFATESYTSNGFMSFLADHRRAFLRAVRFNDFFWPLVELSWGIGAVIIYAFGVRLLDTNTITVGLLVAFTGYLGMFWQPVMNISNFYNQLITNLAGADRIFEILDLSPDIDENKEGYTLPPIKGHVEFKNVSFSYDGKNKVLKNVNFNIKPGETIALIGPTGAGKTTIINLLSRFYDIHEGEIQIDGHNVKEVSLDSLRSQMGIMMQDTFMFSGTIKDNIKYGKLDATDEEVEAAAKAVHAHDFIIKLPNGYNTNVNERGTRLSAGQRQMVAFARAILANPRILILDEATASIDTHTERLVQKGIDMLLKGRTSFVIAHRLSTIRNADRIFVIDHGVIKEVGNHYELMQKKGLYYDLIMAQNKFLDAEVG